MKTITVNTSKHYTVYVGQDLLASAGTLISSVVDSEKAVIISDSNVFPLHGSTLVDSLTASGYQVINYVIPAGEESKNGNTYLDILNFLASNQITRSDVLIALGGGVTGDITGFVAATYLRGIPYVQIPTSLLAMVDSSVGGKTAIDLPAGKNLVGAFYQPSVVLCDLDTLNTLPQAIFCDGCAEVIKYSILFDPQLFNTLMNVGINFPREDVISRCIELKRDIVNADEFDKGKRQLLNLGHTLGHGIEASSHFTLSHGKSVAIGTVMITKAAVKYGFCAQSIYNDICRIFELFSLPCATDVSTDALFQIALSDKKRFGHTVNLIIPQKIGQCIIHKINTEDLQSFIEAGI